MVKTPIHAELRNLTQVFEAVCIGGVWCEAVLGALLELCVGHGLQ